MKGWKTLFAMTAMLGVAAAASAQQPSDCCSNAGQFYQQRNRDDRRWHG